MLQARHHVTDLETSLEQTTSYLSALFSGLRRGTASPVAAMDFFELPVIVLARPIQLSAQADVENI